MGSYRCDWRDPNKRNGEIGRLCGQWAAVQVLREVDGHIWTNYRCGAHTPIAETRIGRLELVDVSPKTYVRGSSRDVADEGLRGF